jgi:hypothetical protein
VGATALVVARVLGAVTPFGGMPIIELLGIVYAVLLGAYLAPRVSRLATGPSAYIGAVYGAAAAAAVAATIMPIPPLVFIALAASAMAWPLAVPAGVAWAVAIRSPQVRGFLGHPIRATIAVVGALALLGWRYTQPLVIGAVDGQLCVSFAGESIQLSSWSPSGRWLAISSNRGYLETHLRILDTDSGRIHAVDVGDGVLSDLGVAIDDDGAATYQAAVPLPGSPTLENEIRLRVASPSASPTDLGSLPALLIVVGTRDGAVGLLDPSQARGSDSLAVWLRPSDLGVDFVALTEDEIRKNPGVGLALAEYDGTFTVELPTGVVEVAMPSDASSQVSITTDHRHLVYQARHVTVDGILLYEGLVAQSIATGDRMVLRQDGAAWDARIAGGRVAYLTYPGAENRLCVARLDASLGLD